jgi:ribosomal protein S18 acetylase RimI-like enzyme
MPSAIRPLEPADVPFVVDFAVRAWEPVFESLEHVLGHDMFEAMHEGGWRPIQARAVEEACTSSEMTTWVADDAGTPRGFVTVQLRPDDREGEIYMIAVDPASQQRGVGAQLTDHAVAWIAEQGMRFAVVATGGDPGHAPARATYEAAGFTVLPLARYYKAL